MVKGMNQPVREFDEFYAKESRSSLWKSGMLGDDDFGKGPPSYMTAGHLGPEPKSLYT